MNIKNIFSISNENNYIIWTILGIKFKFKNYKIIAKNQEQQIKLFTKHVNIGLIDNIDGPFRKYFIENNMVEKIELFKKNLDEQSLQLTEKTLQKMLILPDLSLSKYFYLNIEKFNNDFLNDLEKQYQRDLQQNKKNIEQKYKLAIPKYDFEVFLYHHGLKYANDNIKNYIIDKDFIDAGAYIGDSALVLFEYSPKTVHSFEIAKQYISYYKKTMSINNIPLNKYKLNNYALGGNNIPVNVNFTGEMNTNIYNGSGKAIKKITLDSYSKNLNIGFIKADIEGACFEALSGMKETIKNNRPVLSLSIYHTGTEFFETKILLDQIVENLNYKINLECHFPDPRHIWGTVLMAYPKELDS